MGGVRFAWDVAIGVAFVCAWAAPCRAWLFHEHAAVTVEGARTLPDAERRTLDSIWRVVRGAMPELPLASDVGATDSAVPDTCDAGPRCMRRQIGFGPLPALAGDHSCTPDELGRVLEVPWVDDVLAEAERMEQALAEGVGSGERLDEWHVHHLEMRSVDAGYRSRAAGSNAHFQLPRRLGEELSEYVRRVVADEVNGMALYLNYHLAALSRAQQVHRVCPSGERQCLEPQAAALWGMLLTEAFALHFLEDAFSAGHVVGSYGSDNERMGTHDYYCRHGLEVTPWGGGDSYHAHGDAHLTEVDRARVAAAVRVSLGQVIGAVRDGIASGMPVHGGRAGFDACAAGPSPRGLTSAADWSLVEDVTRQMIRPRPSRPLPPRFATQLGAFLSITVAGGGGGEPFDLRSDPAVSRDDRWGGMVQARLGGGIAAEGVTSSAMDSFVSVEGLLEAEVGYGSGRSIGLGVHAHVPWAYLPADGLVYLAADGLADALHGPAMTALGGGPGGWQRPRTIFAGARLQPTLFRRYSFVWYPDYRETDSGSKDRYRFVFPLFTVLFGQEFSEMHSSQYFVDLSLDYSWVPNAEHAVGFRFDVGLTTRRFSP